MSSNTTTTNTGRAEGVQEAHPAASDATSFPSQANTAVTTDGFKGEADGAITDAEITQAGDNADNAEDVVAAPAAVEGSNKLKKDAKNPEQQQQGGLRGMFDRLKKGSDEDVVEGKEKPKGSTATE